MKTHIKTLGLMLFFTIAISCSDEPDTPNNPIEKEDSMTLEELGVKLTGDELSEEHVEELDGIPSKEIDVHQVILPNGMTIADFENEVSGGRKNEKEEGPQKIKNKIISEMLKRASFLTNRTNHIKSSDGVDKPEQNGLAYAIGNKDFTSREKPTSTPGPSFEGITTDYVYGLDCSGFLAESVNEVLNGGILKGNVRKQIDTAMWNMAIKKNFGEMCSKVKMVDKGHLPFDELITGDIIYWLTGGNSHIAFVADLPGPTKFIFNSNGSTGTKCYKKVNAKVLVDKDNNPIIDTECLRNETEKNRSKNRGPRIMTLHDATTISGFWGNDYKVLRLVTDINGEWKLVARCEGQSRDAIEAVINLTSKKEVNGVIAIDANGTGTDYTGDPINFTVSGNYNTTTNVLKGSVIMTFPNNPNDGREDGFEVKLSKDDTDYFTAEMLKINGGCGLQFRLINNGCNGSKNGRMELLSGSSEGMRRPKVHN